MNPSFVNAFQVAPRAETRDVLRRVVAASRAKLEVVRRDVAAPADRALTAVAVALVDRGIRHRPPLGPPMARTIQASTVVRVATPRTRRAASYPSSPARMARP